MNELKIIEQREVLGQDFKIYGDFENPLFLAKDVAEWIEHSNPSKMVLTIDEDEKVLTNSYTLGGNQECLFLTENGPYEVLFQSRKPIAKLILCVRLTDFLIRFLKAIYTQNYSKLQIVTSQQDSAI